MTHTTRPRCSPTLTHVSKGVRSSLGFTLTEALLALGVVTAATGTMFLFFGQVDAKAKLASETRNLRELSRRIESSFGMVGTFRGVSTTAVVVDGLAPDSQLGAGESVLTNAWGGAVNVQPYTVDRFGDSFSVSYAGLPRQACVALVAANAGGVWDAQVSDVSVIRNTGGQLDVGLLSRTCADKSRVVFVYHSGLLGGEWTGSPLVLPPATPPATPPGSPPVGFPVGPVGPVPPSTPVSPPTAPPPSVPPTTPPPTTPPAPPVSVTPPAPPTSPPVTPPPISTTMPCREWSENRTINCPVGQVGQVFQHRRHHCGTDPSVYEAWAGSTTAGSSRDPQRGMPCRSVWLDRPAADLLMHGHRFVGRLDANQHHLRGLPSTFPTSRNPVGRRECRLPGRPKWIAHVAGRAAADQDGVLQLPGHHVVAAQPDVHHLDKLGGDGGSSQRGQYMHTQRTTPDVSRIHRAILAFVGRRRALRLGDLLQRSPDPGRASSHLVGMHLAIRNERHPHVYARATWRDPPNTGFGSLCLRAARQLNSDARLRLRQPPRHRGLAGGLLVQRRGSRRAVLLARPGSERLGGL
ncbi:MAG TPA: hypothetical protein DCP40_02045 [Stenotrophomonas sp.]|nr:hypothetical protein [Stenotrophomonas sp.]